jgi:two-component system phosphate regulon sensor histidine kinase PhoR
VLALVVAVLMSTLAAHLMTRALRRLVVQAKGLTEHRGPNQIPLSTSQEEIATLAGSLNHMARELEGTVQKLATERDRFQAVLDGMGGAVIAIDENRHITLVNRAALSLLGLSESPVDKPLVEVLRAPAIQNLLQAPVDPAHSIDFEIPGRPPRAINARASKAHLADDTVLVLYDVTDVRRLEKMRTDFVANASHELRTPVSVIQASAEALTSGALSDPARAERFAAAVYRNAERLSRLIADLLDLSRIESTRARPALRPVPVRDLLGHALETLSPIADSNGRRLSLGEVHEVSVLADEAALEQVLTNLIDNAIKYTQPQGQVTLRARARESVVELSVEDDGPGIPDPHKERIFERFYRIDAGRSRELGGTGLGLSIVKNLVLRLGGQIHVEDVVPTGARFVVELPRAAPG